MKQTAEDEIVFQDKVINLPTIGVSEDPEPVPYHFKDGVRRIHCVIVLRVNGFKQKNAQEIVSAFLEFLQHQGLDLEYERGHKDDGHLFVKVHAPNVVIRHLARLYELDIDNIGHNYLPDTTCRWGFRQNKLTLNDNDRFIRMGAPTSCEVIYLLFKVLYEPYNPMEEKVYGVDKMIKLGFVKDAYPLHDGPYSGGKDEVNDRQLLATHWGNFVVWFQEQPINLIEKYFGSDVAFFFAWNEFYLFMLLLLAIAGMLSLASNVLAIKMSNPKYIKQICNSTFIMCPICATEGCTYSQVSGYCSSSKYEYILGTTIQYAIIIAVWVPVFLEFWRRRENTLSVRWNVYRRNLQYRIRYDYQDLCTEKRKSSLTGKEEMVIPPKIRARQIGISYGALTIMILLFISFSLMQSITKIAVAKALRKVKEPNKTLMISFFYGVLQAIFVKICSLFYVKLCVWLTDMEVPRTTQQYEKNLIYKIYTFGFLNNYIPIIYTAIFRDNILILPGMSLLGSLDNYNCLPTGCILTIAIQLFAVVTVKYVGEIIIQMIQMSTSVIQFNKNVPTWEKEYYLVKNVDQVLLYEFSEMMVQFGYVSFLMAMCPFIGPVCFVCNILRIRLNAIRLTRQMRRPIPLRKKGIGAWDDILLFNSYFSVVCNAFIVGFNMRFILFLVHAMYGDIKKTYFEFMFSRLSVKDGLPAGSQRLTDSYTECVYTGQKNPPIHKFKYKKSNDYYAVLSWQFIFIIVFENVILIVVACIYYFVSDVPKGVREQLRREKQVVTDQKVETLEKKIERRLSRPQNEAERAERRKSEV
ncbi:hypothetical protein WA026_010228 [Henosepilachna vigintioctopunctata]|uniref:Anoctamin n=1 Tax=Henosepilachna vigintioctopunctata TaxID=420089 RepID=A0AAW1UCH1_9CUCU